MIGRGEITEMREEGDEGEELGVIRDDEDEGIKGYGRRVLLLAVFITTSILPNFSSACAIED